MAESKYDKYFIIDPPAIQSGPRAFHNQAKNKWAFGRGFLSGDLIKGAPLFSDVVLVKEPPDPQPFINPHAHKTDEVLLFLSISPDGELGADVEIEIGREREKHSFHRSALVYVPKLTRHCPINFNNFQKDRQFYMISFLLQPEYD
jgi:hypothetical protein